MFLLTCLTTHSQPKLSADRLFNLYERNYCVVFCWVPGHVGLPDVAADATAKETYTWITVV